MVVALHLRPAAARDAAAAVPLIYSSGPAAFDYVFDVPGRARALEFLQHAFVQGRGEFGWRNHVVADFAGSVVAVGAAWSGKSNLGFAVAGARQILACYGIAQGPATITRGLKVESVVQPPRRDRWYVAHLGVAPGLRSRGIGEALVRHLLEAGRRERCRFAELDVAATNPRAQALYERLGFRVTHERPSTLSNARATVPDHRRMAMAL